jgi:hypothetical protein
MNIRDPQKFLETQWDWTPFNGVFAPTGIRITDIDGAVECNGKFLIIETKLPNQPIPTGQRLMFDHMVSLKCFTVLIVWGRPNQAEHAQLWGRGEKVRTTQRGFIEYVARWFAWANKKQVAS